MDQNHHQRVGLIVDVHILRSQISHAVHVDYDQESVLMTPCLLEYTTRFRLQTQDLRLCVSHPNDAPCRSLQPKRGADSFTNPMYLALAMYVFRLWYEGRQVRARPLSGVDLGRFKAQTLRKDSR